MNLTGYVSKTGNDEYMISLSLGRNSAEGYFDKKQAEDILVKIDSNNKNLASIVATKKGIISFDADKFQSVEKEFDIIESHVTDFHDAVDNNKRDLMNGNKLPTPDEISKKLPGFKNNKAPKSESIMRKFYELMSDEDAEKSAHKMVDEIEKDRDAGKYSEDERNDLVKKFKANMLDMQDGGLADESKASEISRLLEELAVEYKGYDEKTYTMTLAVNGKDYQYKLEDDDHEHFLKIMKHNKGRALAWLKKRSDLIKAA
jgi:hypothetical protein